MRYLLTPLKFYTCNFRCPTERCLVRINVCMKSEEKQNFNEIMVTSSVLSVCLKRSCHVKNVCQMPQDSNNTFEQNSTENSDFTSITNRDPVLEKKLKMLFLEVEVQR